MTLRLESQQAALGDDGKCCSNINFCKFPRDFLHVNEIFSSFRSTFFPSIQPYFFWHEQQILGDFQKTRSPFLSYLSRYANTARDKSTRKKIHNNDVFPLESVILSSKKKKSMKNFTEPTSGTMTWFWAEMGFLHGDLQHVLVTDQK